MKLKVWLKSNSSTFADRDLRFLIKHSLGKDVLELDEIRKAYIQGMPLAYILGKEEFFGYEFEVSQDVLIPRPETELIVEKAIELINAQRLSSVLDLCCGSGNIAISIAKEASKEISVFASDKSPEALRVAELNATKHKVDINFIQTDLLAGFEQNSFDLIVSNPPYVEDEAIKGSLKYEPQAALSGGGDGLAFINKILDQAHIYLKDKGYLVMEIGYKHKQTIMADKYKLIEWIRDYSGHFRGVVLKNNG